MAQKIAFIQARSIETLQLAVASFVERYELDPRFIIEPFGLVFANGEYVVALRVAGSHKRTFADGGDTPEAPSSGKDHGPNA